MIDPVDPGTRWMPMGTYSVNKFLTFDEVTKLNELGCNIILYENCFAIIFNVRDDMTYHRISKLTSFEQAVAFLTMREINDLS